MIVQNNRRPPDVAIGRRLLTIRKARGLSRESLATRLGVSSRNLWHYERGHKRMRPDLLLRISAILDVRISAFFADEWPSARCFTIRHIRNPPCRSD